MVRFAGCQLFFILTLFALVLRLLRSDAVLKAKIGNPLKVGEFRAYAYKGGLDVKRFSYTPSTH